MTPDQAYLLPLMNPLVVGIALAFTPRFTYVLPRTCCIPLRSSRGYDAACSSCQGSGMLQYGSNKCKGHLTLTSSDKPAKGYQTYPFDSLSNVDRLVSELRFPLFEHGVCSVALFARMLEAE